MLTDTDRLNLRIALMAADSGEKVLYVFNNRGKRSESRDWVEHIVATLYPDAFWHNQEVEFPGGGIIHFIHHSRETALKGRMVDVLIFDEALSIGKEVYEALTPCLAGTKQPVVINTWVNEE